MDEWTSVKEKLPEPDENSKDFSIEVLAKSETEKRITRYYFPLRKWFCEFEATHWMKIPD